MEAFLKGLATILSKREACKTKEIILNKFDNYKNYNSRNYVDHIPMYNFYKEG